MNHSLFKPAVLIFSAAMLLSSGCLRSTDETAENGDTPPAANAPQIAAESATAPAQAAPRPLPAEGVPAAPLLTGAGELKLEPQVLTAPGGDVAPPKPPANEVPQNPFTVEVSPKPAEIAPPPAIAETTVVPDKPFAAPSDITQGNPLRGNPPPNTASNPIRNSNQPTLPPSQPPLNDTAATPAPPAAPPAELPAAITNPPATAENPLPATASKKTDSTFDPIKENGPIFVDWPQPKLALVITGREDGYIEPCGCAGLDRMKGGLSRRHTMIEGLKKQGWPVLCIDVGGLSKGYGVQAELKFQITVDAMKKMGYQAVGFSPNDLRLPVDSLVAVAADSKDNPSPFISANIGLLGFDAGITAPWRVVEVGGVRIGVTSVMGEKFAEGIAGDDIEIVAPEVALAQVMPELNKRSELKILLAYDTVENSIALSKRFPEFAVVVTSEGPPSPPAKPTVIPETKALLIEVGEKGMDAIVLGLYADENQPYRYQRVPLDSRFPASKDMKNLMIAYQDRLRTLGLAGLSIKPVTHPSREQNGEFVGSVACQSCHEESYEVWKRSGHAKAWDTLKQADPPRDADPECISCHVIGWHPTSHFPYLGGFLDERETPKMLDVGCESCHGPGGNHVKAEMGTDKDYQARMQKAVRVTKEEAETQAEKACQNCHDLDNSPDFKFETYWPKVEHSESD